MKAIRIKTDKNAASAEKTRFEKSTTASMMLTDDFL